VSSADIINEVWMWEAVLTGDTALINGKALLSVCMSFPSLISVILVDDEGLSNSLSMA
jgi:hypothetical protein